MLPLRATTGVSRFPWGTAALILVFVAIELVLRLSPGTRSATLLEWVPVPASFSPERSGDWLALGRSLVVFGNLFALWITCLYVWSFVPSFVERTSLVWAFVASLAVSVATYFLYRAYHGPLAVAPLLLSQVWVSALLGHAMRHEIWDTVSTFVFGPKILQVYEVPSYVLLFFWFFYIMVGNLFLEAPFSDAPTFYFLPLVAFILGFLVETLRMTLWKSKTASSSNVTLVLGVLLLGAAAACEKKTETQNASSSSLDAPAVSRAVAPASAADLERASPVLELAPLADAPRHFVFASVQPRPASPEDTYNFYPSILRKTAADAAPDVVAWPELRGMGWVGATELASKNFVWAFLDMQVTAHSDTLVIFWSQNGGRDWSELARVKKSSYLDTFDSFVVDAQGIGTLRIRRNVEGAFAEQGFDLHVTRDYGRKWTGPSFAAAHLALESRAAGGDCLFRMQAPESLEPECRLPQAFGAAR